MKIIKSLIVFSAIFSIFLSCQKELSFDNGGVSTGTLKKDASGGCLPVTVNGIFIVDTVLTNASYVDVEVNVTNPGSFDIKTDTVNGYSFSKTGNVVFGANTIRLYATGKPTAAGTNTFTVKYGTSTCSFSITVSGPGVVPAVFTLGGSPALCTGAVAGGTYTAGTPLTPANTLTIQVNVTTPGTYVIGAASTNGFVFSGTGIFTTTGLQNVTLTGVGTPAAAGISLVTVTNVTSTCTYAITVQGATPAVFTLSGAPANCTGAILSGTYTVGSSTSATHTVKLNVDVTTAGSYNITTNASNGLTFSASGVFTTTGAQTVTLTATGTPTAAGAFNFSPTAGTSTCSFSVNCVAAPPVPAGDYFPLTNNSWWSYDIVSIPDSIYNVIIGTKAYNGNTYSEMQSNYQGFPEDTLHYRKNGNNYFHWVISDYYSAQFAFDNPSLVDINFLRENAATGTTWSSAEYTGTAGGATPAKLRYDFKIQNANTSIVVNGKNFTNVIAVSVTVQLSVSGLPYTPIERNDFYYAKGIGLVKIIYNDLLGGSVLGEIDIRNYQVL